MACTVTPHLGFQSCIKVLYNWKCFLLVSCSYMYHSMWRIVKYSPRWSIPCTNIWNSILRFFNRFRLLWARCKDSAVKTKLPPGTFSVPYLSSLFLRRVCTPLQLLTASMYKHTTELWDAILQVVADTEFLHEFKTGQIVRRKLHWGLWDAWIMPLPPRSPSHTLLGRWAHVLQNCNTRLLWALLL